MEPPFRLLRDALGQLTLEPEEQRAALAGTRQRAALAGTIVTDELALDLDNAMQSLPHASEPAGVSLDEKVRAILERLNRLFDAEPAAELWDDEALDTHPTWGEARALAREVLPLIPSDGWPPGETRCP